MNASPPTSGTSGYANYVPVVPTPHLQRISSNGRDRDIDVEGSMSKLLLGCLEHMLDFLAFWPTLGGGGTGMAEARESEERAREWLLGVIRRITDRVTELVLADPELDILDATEAAYEELPKVCKDSMRALLQERPN